CEIGSEQRACVFVVPGSALYSAQSAQGWSAEHASPAVQTGATHHSLPHTEDHLVRLTQLDCTNFRRTQTRPTRALRGETAK
ncbi:hypothetical protein Ciccas_013892, partial [Cichlidogyrus casuarinus]